MIFDYHFWAVITVYTKNLSHILFNTVAFIIKWNFELRIGIYCDIKPESQKINTFEYIPKNLFSVV